jgi:hypothetical protein
MLEFSLALDLGKRERITPETESLPVDRAFVARCLIAVAAKIQEQGAGSRGPIVDDTGLEVGNWGFSLLKRAD